MSRRIGQWEEEKRKRKWKMRDTPAHTLFHLNHGPLVDKAEESNGEDG